MPLKTRLLILAMRFVSYLMLKTGLGAGATWPGEIALFLSPKILRVLGAQLKEGIILVVGTNGKTTTAMMIKQILTSQGKRVIHNGSGANLLNGIVSAFIQASDWMGHMRADWGVFEVDENSLPLVLQYVHPTVIVALNLFRDQLDRYGEVDMIVEKWTNAIKRLTDATTFVLNSDDPQIAYLGKSASGNVIYFGLNDTSKYLARKEHATDSTFCPKCGSRLIYEGIYYSHIGVWRCDACGTKRRKPYYDNFPPALPGLYNQYNTLAAVACARVLKIPKEAITFALKSLAPVFGRQEELVVKGKRIKLFLSKNPAGFNMSLRTALEMGAQDILLVLNDRIPDGRDVSWIWDMDVEMIPPTITPAVSGLRAWDMALRVKYARNPQTGDKPVPPIMVYEHLETALSYFTESSDMARPLYILATYSGMLETRKILTGRKIL